MATWMAMDQFLNQRAAMSNKSPNPAEFSEGNSYWIDQYPIDFENEWRESPLPQGPIDVVIIGSGITGATVAYQLAKTQPYLKVAVLEARGICTGATGRNGGHLSRPEVHGLVKLRKTFGGQDAVRLKILMRKTRDMMLDVIDELQIAEKVELSLKGTIVTFKTEQQREEFEKDMQCARELGISTECHLMTPEELVKRTSIPEEFARYGAAILEKSGTIFPRKFVAELFRFALKQMSNLTIHPYTPVWDIKRDYSQAYPYTIETKQGSIPARTVFHATNAYANNLLDCLVGETGVFGCSCHVMAVQPKAGSKQFEPGYGWDDMWYWVAPQPKNGPWVYGYSFTEKIGDYDDSKGLPADHEHRTQMNKFLEDQFPQHFPKINFEKDVTHNWTGIQGYTDNGASLVGRPIKESGGEFMCVGHNGEGMGRCFSAATIATEAMLNYLNGGKPTDYVPPEWFPHAYRRNI